MKKSFSVAISLLLASSLFTGATIGAAAPATSQNPNTVEQKQAQATEVRQKLDALSVQLETAGEEYGVAQETLDKTKEQITTAQSDISAAKENVASAKEQLSKQMSSSYRRDSSSYLEVLLGSTDFKSFVTNFSFLERIFDQNNKTIETYNTAQKDLEAKQNSLNQRLTEEKILTESAKRKSDTINSSLREQKSILDSLDGDIAALIEEQREEIAKQQQLASAGTDSTSNPNTNTGASQPSGGNTKPTEQPSPSPPPAPTPTPKPDEKPTTGGGVTNPPASSGRTFNASKLGAPNPGVVTQAKKYLGVQYVWGGTSPKGFDCSGLTQYSYKAIGISIPRTSRSQFSDISGYIPPNRTDLLSPGDLVFFGTRGSQSAIHHVGIYLGNGSYIHAPQTGEVVKISYGLFSSKEFVGATRP